MFTKPYRYSLKASSVKFPALKTISTRDSNRIRSFFPNTRRISNKREEWRDSLFGVFKSSQEQVKETGLAWCGSLLRHHEPILSYAALLFNFKLHFFFTKRYPAVMLLFFDLYEEEGGEGVNTRNLELEWQYYKKSYLQ